MPAFSEWEVFRGRSPRTPLTLRGRNPRTRLTLGGRSPRTRLMLRGRNLRAWLAVSGWVFFAVLILLSCRSSTDSDPQPALTLDLDAVPTLLKSDSTQIATIWATVLEHGNPAADSTLVSFVATRGEVEPEAYTRDGLARVVFRPGSETGVAAVVAQVRAVRDTVLLTIY